MSVYKRIRVKKTLLVQLFWFSLACIFVPYWNMLNVSRFVSKKKRGLFRVSLGFVHFN